MRTKNFISGLIFAIIGAIIVFFGISMAISNNKFMDSAKTTIGKISDITATRDSDGDYSYTAYVEYTVDGELYEARSSYYSSSMRIGEEIEIYYSPENPSKFMVEGQSSINIILPLFGLIFFAAGLAVFISELNAASIKKYVLNNGQMVEAKIKDVNLHRSYSNTNRRYSSREYSIKDIKNSYTISCEWVNPATGMLHLFESEKLWFDPTALLAGRETINVYVDMNNPKRYYVDTRNLISNIIV